MSHGDMDMISSFQNRKSNPQTRSLMGWGDAITLAPQFSLHLHHTRALSTLALVNSGIVPRMTGMMSLSPTTSTRSLFSGAPPSTESILGSVRSVRHFSMMKEMRIRLDKDKAFQKSLQEFKSTWQVRSSVATARFISRVVHHLVVSLPLWLIKALGFTALSKMIRCSLVYVLWSNPAVSRAVRPGVVHAVELLPDPSNLATQFTHFREISMLEKPKSFEGPQLETNVVALVPYRGSLWWRLTNSVGIRDRGCGGGGGGSRAARVASAAGAVLIAPLRVLAWLWSPAVKLWRHETALAAALRLARVEVPGFSLEGFLEEARSIVPCVLAAEYEAGTNVCGSGDDFGILDVLCSDGVQHQIRMDMDKRRSGGGGSASSSRDRFLHVSGVELLAGRIVDDLPQLEVAVHSQVFKGGVIRQQLAVWMLQPSANRRHWQVG